MSVSSGIQNQVIELWRPVQQKAYWTVMSVVDDRQLTEDVLQEALVIAMQKFHTLKDATKFNAWFLTIAVRVAYQVLAKNKHTLWVDDITPYVDDQTRSEFFVDATLLQAEYKMLVFQIITQLKSERLRHLFYLRYIEDKTIEQISGITEMKIGSLKALYHQMRKDISDILNKEYYRYG